MSDQTDGITVVHAPERHRYELRDKEAVIGFTKYRLAAQRNQVVFVHTEVDEAYGGRGLAARLAKFALEDVVAAGKRILPLCPYIASYLRRHHEYDESVDRPREAAPEATSAGQAGI